LQCLWLAGDGLGWRPHAVKGPEIGRHPNPSPADEFCWNSKVEPRIQGVVEVGLAAEGVVEVFARE